MLRVTLALRVALIGAIAFSAAVTVIVAVFYRSLPRESDLTRVSPVRLAALAAQIEQTAPGARQYQDASPGGTERGECCTHLAVHLGIEAVEALGTIEGEARDAVLDRKHNALVAHGVPAYFSS